jgi:hypothetical protein
MVSGEPPAGGPQNGGDPNSGPDPAAESQD